MSEPRMQVEVRYEWMKKEMWVGIRTGQLVIDWGDTDRTHRLVLSLERALLLQRVLNEMVDEEAQCFREPGKEETP